MKEYFKDLISRIKRFSSNLDVFTLLVDKNWRLINDPEGADKLFIFERNNRLLISNNGVVELGKWEQLNSGPLLFDLKDISLLFSHGFVDNHRLVLKLDNIDEFYLFEKDEISGLIKLDMSGMGNSRIMGAAKTYLPGGLGYQILTETEGWGGNFVEYEVIFSNNKRGKFMYNKLENLYYHFELQPKTYFKDKESCLKNLKLHLK